ncbi:YceD family protein [Sphingomonas sp. PB2P19]|uniref:YceD family protein n=1 Tax=Sphingomonas rhamnosi TaxID=3096156 RepID=UPI002FC9CE4F
MTPEFSRRERLDTIGERERSVTITADAGEREAVAKRFGLVSVGRLEATLAIRRDAGSVLAHGRVSGDVVQACSVTDAPLSVTIDEPVSLRFVEELASDVEEIELSEDVLDTMPIESGAIDLGEAAAETLALALDPFPRGPGAAAALTAAGVVAEEDFQPVNAFAGLKAKMGGTD